MANFYKSLNRQNDIVNTRTLLHEAIPLTGSIVSGTYADNNIKTYSHAMLESVYDYPYLSSSANHVFDITAGYSAASGLSASTNTQNSKKINMYNTMAQILLGYTASQADGIHKFEPDLVLDRNAASPMKEVFFINLSRLLTKDQIKKGTFSLTLATGSWDDATVAGQVATITDASASDNGGTMSVLGGDMALLYAGNGPLATYVESKTTGDRGGCVGNIFYQAGIIALSASVFAGWQADHIFSFQIGDLTKNEKTVDECLTTSTISASCNAFRHRICNIAFNNTTEINSNIYFCRVPWNRYNYSTNPTYLSGAEIRVKNIASDSPISYITTIGMYNTAGELLATAKLSEPLRKDPTNELTLRVRLDY